MAQAEKPDEAALAELQRKLKLKPFTWKQNTADLRDKTRQAVFAWMTANPEGSYVEMVVGLWPQFPYKNYDIVLRGILFAVDQQDSRPVTGVTGSPG